MIADEMKQLSILLNASGQADSIFLFGFINYYYYYYPLDLY